MGLQDLVDAMNQAGKHERANYHLNLGDLLEVLREADGEALVTFDDGGSPNAAKSYRGYYSDLALSTASEDRTVSEVLDTLESVHGTELTGYKGGQFLMGDNVPLWRAEWGDLGDPLMGVETDGGDVVLVTGEREF